MNKSLTINLLALTGFGNFALKTLANNGCNIKAIYTRQETGKFPYYPEEQLDLEAKKLGISIIYVGKSDWEIGSSADINLTCTFHRILKPEHLKKAKFNINLHPSLLPSYKGPTPTNWQIHNKEKTCGLTAHFLTSEADCGPIIWQEEYELSVTNDSDLRFFLAQKSPKAIEYIINNYPNYPEIKSHYEPSYQGSYYKEGVIK